MSFAEVNGARVVTASIGVPSYGVWQGDVMLAEGTAISNPVTLTIGNLSLRGAVYRQATYAGAQRARLVGGAGGWRKSVPAQGYSSSSGVRLSTVLRDAAALVGEQVAIAADRVLGTAYVREAAPASRVLRQLADNWYVDGAGVTQIRERTRPTITSPFDVIAWDAAKGIVEVATEDYAAWVPGASFSAPTISPAQTISFARFHVDNRGALRLAVMVAP